MPDFGKSVDATDQLRDRRILKRLPIVVLEYALRHSHSREVAHSSSSAQLSLSVGGVEYTVSDVTRSGPVHAFDIAFREVLSQYYGESAMRCVCFSGFNLYSREENPLIEEGMGVRAHVRIGFMSALDAAGRVMPVEDGDPIAARKLHRCTTARMIRWNAKAESEDSIEAAVQALCDGYNYFVTEILHVSKHVHMGA